MDAGAAGAGEREGHAADLPERAPVLAVTSPWFHTNRPLPIVFSCLDQCRHWWREPRATHGYPQVNRTASPPPEQRSSHPLHTIVFVYSMLQYLVSIY